MRATIVVLACGLVLGCGSATGSGGNGGSGGGGAGGDDMADGTTTPAQPGTGNLPVEIDNASMRALGGDRFELSFAFVDNVWQTNRVARLDRVVLSWQNGNVTILPVQCSQDPWTVAQKTVSPLTIDVSYDAATMTTALYVPCGSGARTQTSEETQAAAPSGVVHVQLEGILGDASPFVAAANAPVM